jgi:amidohydrolase
MMSDERVNQIRAEAEAAAMRERLVNTRRDLHAHPELAFQEMRTAGLVAARLADLGYEVQTGVGKTGVVGILEGAQGTPSAEVLLLRFDMDALPIHELNDMPYRSQNDGVMHACGHDAHTAIGLGVAELLAAHRAEWGGTAKFVFQPAEETVAGALAMIADGVLRSPQPQRVLSLHVDSKKPVGSIYMTDGPMMAAADGFTVVVKGRGTHGAAPHQGSDPIVGAAQMVTALQSIVARNVNPLDPAVITVGYLHGGSALNIIPERVEFGGTMRSYTDEVALLLRRRLREVVEQMAAAMGLQAEVTFPEHYTPPTVNDPAVAALVRDTARQLVGEQHVFGDYRMMGAEDASYFLQAMPGAYVFVGAGNVEKGIHEPHHSPRFNIDEDALPLATALVTASALRIFGD